jgi:hypothetical protein
MYAVAAIPVAAIPRNSSASFLAGLNLYHARLDKGYSLTDCLSMETMRSNGIADVPTNDAHFGQEGFRAVFRGRWHAVRRRWPPRCSQERQTSLPASWERSP